MSILEKDLKARAERRIEQEIGQVSPTAQDFARSNDDKIVPSSSSTS
jgi:hypothetical protein